MSIDRIVRFFRAAGVTVLATAASAGSLACSSPANTGSASSANDNGAPNANGGPVSNGVPNGNGNGGNGGNGGGDTTAAVGTITLSQTNMAFYNLDAAFMRGVQPRAVSTSCPGALTLTTMGACSAAVYCVVPQDADAGVRSGIKGLNAGTITVAGNTAGAGPAALNFAPSDGYPTLSGFVPFYAAGDAISVSGAGGADLPAFSPQTVVAPADVTFAAPCTGSGDGLVCPDIDRTVDLHVAWTGGGAGKVTVLYTTLTPTLAAGVSCSFNAADGAGTIPSALLANLAKAGNGSEIDGNAIYGVTNASPSFMVGDVLTTFEIDGTSAVVPLNVSK